MIHSDLKARNVLLKRDGASGHGVVAKVADFGLSVRLDAAATHVSEFQVCCGDKTQAMQCNAVKKGRCMPASAWVHHWKRLAGLAAHCIIQPGTLLLHLNPQGTISHMAPETQLEHRVTMASDVYSFGITLWELFTGGHAFKGARRAAGSLLALAFV